MTEIRKCVLSRETGNRRQGHHTANDLPRAQPPPRLKPWRRDRSKNRTKGRGERGKAYFTTTTGCERPTPHPTAFFFLLSCQACSQSNPHFSETATRTTKTDASLLHLQRGHPSTHTPANPDQYSKSSQHGLQDCQTETTCCRGKTAGQEANTP